MLNASFALHTSTGTHCKSMSEFDIEDEEDDLFEDATDDVEPDTEEIGVDMDDVDGEPEGEAENEGDEEEEDEIENENIDELDDNGDNDEVDDSTTNMEIDEMSDANIKTENGHVAADSVTEPVSSVIDSELTDQFKSKYPMQPGIEMIKCSSYDIVPYVAAIHACEVHCVAVSWGLKYMFTGGQDGFIRKYNFIDSINGKLPLTVAQRHPFVDSITKAGVLMSYWENEQPQREKSVKVASDGSYEPKLSPVYSMAVQSEAIWLLSGLQSGGITLQSVRFNEGQIQYYLDGHTSAVSTIKLDDAETHALSGSWDKTVIEWDLNTGSAVTKFSGASGQISSLEWQPVGGALISDSLRQAASQKGGNGNQDEDQERRKSLGSLFGDEDEENDEGDTSVGANDSKQDIQNGNKSIEKDEGDDVNTDSSSSSSSPPPTVQHSHSVFLTSSIDGTIDIWDRRQKSKSGTLKVPSGVPPWCTSACWGVDGNFIYAGRRNSTIDEFDIRASLTKQSKVFKFPSVSGAVSVVRAMPTGRHLLCGSNDNIRLYDLSGKSKIPFYIIPGHHGAVVSDIYVDPSCQFMITSSGSRGWQGNSSDVALVYSVQPVL
jgi:transcriptional activator SPT8